jgi:8-oxo-dGTP diphosphatase
MHKCVGAVIIQDESILLGKRAADRGLCPNVWDVFGGHIESGESHQQALERELVEELGIVPTGYRYLETVSAPSPTEGDRIECHLYLVTEWNGTPTNRQPQEHSEIGWFRFGEVSHLELAAPEYERIVQGISSMPEKVMPKSGVGGSASPPPNTPLQPTVEKRGG